LFSFFDELYQTVSTRWRFLFLLPRLSSICRHFLEPICTSLQFTNVLLFLRLGCMRDFHK
jgi:hypothetical protein